MGTSPTSRDGREKWGTPIYAGCPASGQITVISEPIAIPAGRQVFYMAC
jgi:hypothetical protein